jgi:hypothetical protein
MTTPPTMLSPSSILPVIAQQYSSYVIAQQYSSSTFFSLRFPPPQKKNVNMRFKTVIFPLFNC